MNNKKVVLRLDEHSLSEKYDLCRITGTATVDSMIRLIDNADLKANARDAKTGSVTNAIQETLEKSPKLFPFKSKGILLASGDCKELERSRFELCFDNEFAEGVLDGGHNLLAIGIHILKKSLGEDHETEIKKIKRWPELESAWIEHRSEIDLGKIQDKFLVPIEILYPRSGEAGRKQYEDAILEIASARNNNSELSETTKANKAGFYDPLRASIDKTLEKEIEWKTNDGGRIKVQDLIALLWVPLSILDDKVLGNNRIAPATTYSSKGTCATTFNKLVEEHWISKRENGLSRIFHPGILSAIALLKDLPRLYDLLYQSLPDAYNSVSPRFGGIESVRKYEPRQNGSKNPKYLKKQPVTKYYKKSCEFDYPDGFIAPLVWALRELMEVKDGKVDWIPGINPDAFIREHLPETMKVFYGMFQMANWDSQVIGKTGACYELMCNDFRGRLPR
jgi:hypothetical protein